MGACLSHSSHASVFAPRETGAGWLRDSIDCVSSFCASRSVCGGARVGGVGVVVLYLVVFAYGLVVVV